MFSKDSQPNKPTKYNQIFSDSILSNAKTSPSEKINFR